MVDASTPIDSFMSRAALLSPKLVSAQSAWNEHIPFAGWIVEATEPRRIVELGTHAGVSYFAFCEAVSQLDLEAECFAVDHWKGDEHSGFYGEEVYQAVKALNDEHYSSFSHLIRSSFDDALDRFEDGSIDLLHIDGLHTYQAVKHDVESWWPKLSDRGVLLLHDTNERKRDFGVYRVLSELSQDRPVFEFPHGHGLGVVVAGPKAPRSVLDLVELQGEVRDSVRDLYQELGRRFAQEIELEHLSSRFTASQQAFQQTRVDLTRREAKIEQLEAELTQTRCRLSQATADLAASRTFLAQARQSETIGLAKQRALEESVSQARSALERTKASLERTKASLKRTKASLEREQKARKTTARKLDRLRKRRGVRFALSLARVARPLFRWKRRGMAGGEEVERTEPMAALEAPTPSAPDEDVFVGPRTSEARSRWQQHLRERLEDPLPVALLIGEPQPVEVIVPVYNAPDALVRCLTALERNTNGPARLLLIDDASTDPVVAEILSRYESRPGVEVMRNGENLGFTKTVNRGFAATRSDVVILNSDVEVVPGWLDRLRLAARLNPRAATVTPVSDNAGAFSAPQVGTANSTPPGLTRDQVGRLVRGEIGLLEARAPTGNGFCMYVRRSALDEIGLFDEEAFPRGYGEENDWCMRAVRAGWENIVEGSVFVFHERSASFGEEKHDLMERGREIIDERYPDYTERVREYMSSLEAESIRATVAEAFELAANTPTDPRPRILYVLHSGGGGTAATNADLMEDLDGRYESFILNSDGASLTLSRIANGEIEKVQDWRLRTPITPLDERHDEYRSVVGRVLVALDVELVHIRHLIGHSFDLPGLARAMGIPVVLSFHDYYYICPTVHLLDEKDRFCGGRCTPGQGSCRIPTSWLEPVPHLKHNWVYQWRDRVRRLFANIDVFITASDAARSVYLDTYPELEESDFRVIEHGRDFSAVAAEARVGTEVSLDRVKIVVPGNLTVHKGSNYIRALKELDSEGLLEFHFLGTIPESLFPLGIHHGSYSRDNLVSRIAEIQPAMVGVFSVTAETYSHVVSEAWAAGIPVLVTDLGAPAERVERNGGGWVIPHDDPAAALNVIREVASDEEEWRRQRDGANLASVHTLGEMSRDYASLYEEVWEKRRAFRSSDERHAQVSLAVVGHRGEHPGSVYVRSLTRWTHPEMRRQFIASTMDVAHFVTEEPPDRPELVYVQRTAIPVGLVDPFLERCHELGSALMLDLDDDILNLEPESTEFADYQDQVEPLKKVIKAADIVTVSTEPLADTVTGLARRVEVVPNKLDERLWVRPLLAPSSERGPFRVLYYGTRTHSEDLALLRSVVERLGEDRLELYVVGAEEPDDSQDWYRRIEVPLHTSRYPAFVAWLHELKGEFDAAVVPLVDNAFNRSKSDLKYLETAALGLPGVFSDVIPYRGSVSDGNTGLLTKNDPESWVRALTRLATDHDLRNQIREAAYSEVMENGLLRSQMPDYLDLVEALLASRPG